MSEFDTKAATWDDDPQRVARASEIARHLAAQLDLSSIKKVLEYGSGTGLLSLALQDQLADVTLMDESVAMTEITQNKIKQKGLKNWQAITYDLLRQPLPGARYDLIYTMLTLHHIADTAAILQKFYQIALPGAKLCIIDLKKEDGSFHEGDFHGHKGFERQQLETILRQTGWQPANYSICYTITKPDEAGQSKEYPVFMLLADRQP